MLQPLTGCNNINLYDRCFILDKLNILSIPWLADISGSLINLSCSCCMHFEKKSYRYNLILWSMRITWNGEKNFCRLHEKKAFGIPVIQMWKLLINVKKCKSEQILPYHSVYHAEIKQHQLKWKKKLRKLEHVENICRGRWDR